MAGFRKTPLMLDTIGLEIESIAASQHKINSLLLESPLSNYIREGFFITRDASAEIPVASVGFADVGEVNVNVTDKLGKKLFREMERTRIGFEIVSRPLLKNDMRAFVQELLRIMQKGSFFISNRCATHVHIGAPDSIGFLRSALAFSLGFEDLFYMLAGLGTDFRGRHNNSAYCRPFSDGICLENNGTFIKIPNWEKALKSQDLYQFFYCFLVDINKDLIKHHPARYTSINLYSIAEKGTLEFRVANSTFNSRFLNAYISLCQCCAEAINNSYYENFLQYFGVSSSKYISKDFYYKKLEFLLGLIRRTNSVHRMLSGDEKVLFDIIEETPPFKVASANNVLSHVRTERERGGFSFSEELISLGEIQTVYETPVKPGNVDIHNIDDLGSSILEE